MNESFVVVISFTGKSFWGKVGPFSDTSEAVNWAESFRASAREKSLDMTAIAGEDLSQVITHVASKDYLPSRDIEEIIREANINWLLGLGA